MKFYAAINCRGFSNTWDVLVFDSKSARDNFVEQKDGYSEYLQRNVDCRAIKKSQVTEFAANYSMTQNRLIKPRPFTGEAWLIVNNGDCEDFDGYVGEVVVGIPGYDKGERLF